MTGKAELQKQVEELKLEVERHKQSAHIAQTEKQACKNDYDNLKDRTDKTIQTLTAAVDGLRKESKEAKSEAAEYKREISALADTKTVLDRLIGILQNPHNDYQKVVSDLNEMLHQERIRADRLERDLRDIQFDIQQNKFLDGKVQAYESMLKVNLNPAIQFQNNGGCDNPQN